MMIDETGTGGVAQPQTTTLDPERFDAFVGELVKKRDAAVAGRRNCGIEEDWLEDDEFYHGIDDANRGFVRGTAAKADRAQVRGVQTMTAPEGDRSVVFLNITRPYCDAAAARLADMLLPADDPCWAVKPTPIARIDAATSAQLKALNSGVDWQTLQDLIQSKAKVGAKRMGDAIDDLLIESNWHAEARAVIEDAARIGTGVLKGPVPKKKTVKKWTVADGAASLQSITEIKPSSVRVNPWHFYPDPACGDNIHQGAYTWELGYLTNVMLRDLGARHPDGTPIQAEYRPQVIEAALKEGPQQKTSRQDSVGVTVPQDGQYELWTFYGTVTRDQAAASGLSLEELSIESPVVSVLAMLVNDRLIKISLNALDVGEYPYDVLAWQGRSGLPWGSGVGRHIRTPQRMLNASARAMMDNTGMTAAPQVVIGNGITPHDGQWTIRGRKLWRADPETLDVTKAFFCYVPDSHQAEFMAIIEFARSMAEQTTGMPMLLQGQQGDTTDTLGGMQMLQNNATGVLRRLAKRFDDFITEPHISRYFNWLMQYDDRPEIKGDYQIDARGSSALVERDSQKQFMFAAMGFAKDPSFGINPYLLFKELALADRLDPKRIQYAEDDFQSRMSRPDPLAEANAALASAKAENEKAKTVLAKVEALFSAINTANLVAANPAIAPAADATALSAGFVDANAPPIVASVPPSVQPQPMPSNTSPMFPPNPPQADEGLAAGIEGGGGGIGGLAPTRGEQ